MPTVFILVNTWSPSTRICLQSTAVFLQVVKGSAESAREVFRHSAHTRVHRTRDGVLCLGGFARRPWPRHRRRCRRRPCTDDDDVDDDGDAKNDFSRNTLELPGRKILKPG